MRDLLTGEQVTVIAYRQTGTDAFGAPVMQPVEQIVDQVLVAPGPRQDVAETNRPDGVRVAFTLHFPHAFKDSLTGCDVKVRGELFRVIGDPRTFTASNTPTMWNRPVEVYKVEG